jgi:hypothetical protein
MAPRVASAQTFVSPPVITSVSRFRREATHADRFRSRENKHAVNIFADGTNFMRSGTSPIMSWSQAPIVRDSRHATPRAGFRGGMNRVKKALSAYADVIATKFGSTLHGIFHSVAAAAQWNSPYAAGINKIPAHGERNRSSRAATFSGRKKALPQREATASRRSQAQEVCHRAPASR